MSTRETVEAKRQAQRNRRPLLICRWITHHPIIMFSVTLSVQIGLIMTTLFILVFKGPDAIFPFTLDEIPVTLKYEIGFRGSETWGTKNTFDRVVERPNVQAYDPVMVSIFFTHMIYQAENMCTKKNLKKMQEIENNILNATCHRNTTQCMASFDGSIFRVFDGSAGMATGDDRLLVEDPEFERAAELLNIAYHNTTLRESLKMTFGKDFKVDEKHCHTTLFRTLYFFNDSDAIKMMAPMDDLVNKQQSNTEDVKFYYFSFKSWATAAQAQAMSDMVLAVGSFLFIYGFICYNVKSIWIGTWAVFSIINSFIATNLLYIFVLGFNYLGFFHIIAIFMILGLGADDIFVFMDTWFESDAYSYPTLSHRLSDTYRNSIVPMAITSLTTMAAFLVNSFSHILAIQSFGIFSAILVLVNYVSVVTFFPCVLMVHHIYISKISLIQKRRAEKGGPAAHVMVKFFRGPFFKIITHRIFRWVIVVLFSGFVCFMCYEVTKIKNDDKQLMLFTSTNPRNRAVRLRISEFMPSAADWNIVVYIVWGLKVALTSQCYFSDVDCKGKQRLDNSFDMNNADAQLAMKDFCQYLNDLDKDKIKYLYIQKNETSHRPKHTCILNDFEDYLQGINLKLPLNDTNVVPYLKENNAELLEEMNRMSYDRYFDIMIHVWLDETNFNHLELLGEQYLVGNKNLTKLVYFAVSTKLTLNMQEVDFRDALAANKAWQQFVDEIMEKFPEKSNKALQVTVLAWDWNMVKYKLTQGAIQGIIIGICLALPILVLSTANIFIGFMATFTIGAITVSVMGVMPIMGWELGIMETLNMTLVVGLAVDYVVHLAQAYHESIYPDRLRRTRDALESVGVSVLSGAITTMGAAFFMLFAQITFTKQFGTFILFTIGFSLIFALTFFTTMVAIMGPTGNVGNLKGLFKYCSRARRNERKNQDIAENNVSDSQSISEDEQ